MEHIDPKSLEQLDMLLNNLGQMCKRKCENIRSTNARNPERALTQIWNRLDMEYGSAEAIKHAVMQRITYFQSLE